MADIVEEAVEFGSKADTSACLNESPFSGSPTAPPNDREGRKPDVRRAAGRKFPSDLSAHHIRAGCASRSDTCVRDEVPKDAAWSRDAAGPVDRAHDVAATILRAERLEDENVVPPEAAMRAERITVDHAATAGKQRMPITFCGPQTGRRFDGNALLRRPRGAACKLW